MDRRRVPLVDMTARIAPIRAELLAAFERVLDSGTFVMGPEVATLEEEFAAFCGVDHAVAVTNGTAALQLALLAAGVGPGDEVITVANTFIATVEAISAVGATPVFVDVEPASLLMDASAIDPVITTKTRAIIPVHLYGLPCDIDAINVIARRRGLWVIEDACQAHGATYGGALAGSMSDIACFSFYPAKNLGTIGEGGIAVTRDPAMARRMRLLRSHGETQRYAHAEPGWNLRLSELLAAATRVQLRRLDDWNRRRREVAGWYKKALAGLPLRLPHESPQGESAFHLYVVQIEQRDAVRTALEELGVGTAVHYPVPVHLQPAYASLKLQRGALPVTEAAAGRILSLPMFPEMTLSQVEYVAECLRTVLAPTPELVA